MPRQRSDGEATRKKLLEAGGTLFAREGYHDTRTADICRQAGANSAAVSYHFGGKQELYAESWRHAFEQSSRRYPPDGGVAPSAPPEERLRAYLRSQVERIVDPSSIDFDIAHRESVNPTGLLAEVMRRALGPMHEAVLAIVRELVGGGASSTVVRLCEMSVTAQCFGLMRERRRHNAGGALPMHGRPLSALSVDVLVEHFLAFSLAGIRDVKDRNEGAAGRRARGKSSR